MSTLLLDALAEASLRSAALAGLVALVLAVCRVRDATVRHAAWTVVVCAMLLMPALPRLAPVAVSIRLPFDLPVQSEQDLSTQDQRVAKAGHDARREERDT